MAYALTATVNVSTASLTLTATGGVAGDVVYIFRRDASGVNTVRGSYGGLVVPPSGTVTVTDHEATQSGTIDYLLTDVDGALLASATGVAVPLWGTWLKSPARPSRNVRVTLASVTPPTRAARRERFAIEGSNLDVVLSGVRGPAEGAIEVGTADDAAAAAVRLLLSDGETLLIDTPPAWGVPYRYISVGDVTETRPGAVDNALGLDVALRSFVLGDVVEVDPPLGPEAVSSGWTYETVPTLYDSYAALAASFANYDALGTGPG